MNRAGLGVLLAAASAVCAPAAAADLTMRPPAADALANIEIIGGQKVGFPERDWPAVLRFDGDAGPCTSTVVGPRVVLTAAHCVRPGQIGSIQIGGSSIGIACDHHSGYAVDPRLDVALCLASSPVGLPGPNPLYETLATTLPPPQAAIILLGYGCRQPLGGGQSGVLYQGASVIRAVAADNPWMEARGGAAVCYGDSGGGAFSAAAPSRRMLGVNSQGDILDRSLLTAIPNAQVSAFIKAWRTAKGVQVCGLDAVADCRP